MKTKLSRLTSQHRVRPATEKCIAELTRLVNAGPYCVCVSAFDLVGNKIACSDMVVVTPRDGQYDLHMVGISTPRERRWER